LCLRYNGKKLLLAKSLKARPAIEMGPQKVLGMGRNDS